MLNVHCTFAVDGYTLSREAGATLPASLLAPLLCRIPIQILTTLHTLVKPAESNVHCSLQLATAALHSSPALWLRMADCCLGALQQPPGQADVTAQAAQMTALTGDRALVASLPATAQTSSGGCIFRHAQLPWHIRATHLTHSEWRLPVPFSFCSLRPLFPAAFIPMQLLPLCSLCCYARLRLPVMTSVDVW